MLPRTSATLLGISRLGWSLGADRRQRRTDTVLLRLPFPGLLEHQGLLRPHLGEAERIRQDLHLPLPRGARNGLDAGPEVSGKSQDARSSVEENRLTFGASSVTGEKWGMIDIRTSGPSELTWMTPCWLTPLPLYVPEAVARRLNAVPVPRVLPILSHRSELGSLSL